MLAEVPHHASSSASRPLVSAFSYTCNFSFLRFLFGFCGVFRIFVSPKPKLDSEISAPLPGCITGHEYLITADVRFLLSTAGAPGGNGSASPSVFLFTD